MGPGCQKIPVFDGFYHDSKFVVHSTNLFRMSRDPLVNHLSDFWIRPFLLYSVAIPLRPVKHIRWRWSVLPARHGHPHMTLDRGS